MALINRIAMVWGYISMASLVILATWLAIQRWREGREFARWLEAARKSVETHI